MITITMRLSIRRLILVVFFLQIIALISGKTAASTSSSEEREITKLLDDAKWLLSGRQFQQAITALERVLELQPDHAEAHVKLGRAEANLGRYARAEECYLHGLSIDPTYAPARTALGKLYMYQSRLDEARKNFEKAVENDPREADALLGLARLEVQISSSPESLKRAETLYRRSLDLAPRNEQALFDHGIVLSQLGRHEDAARSFSAAVVLNPTINFTLLGQVYQGFEQWGRAVDSYRAALERDPSDIPALLGFGHASEFLGNRREAQMKYTRVIELDADHAKAHASLGMLLTGTGLLNYGAQQACGLNRDEAMWHFHQAIRADPSLQAANDSLEFCLREEIDERQWAERVTTLKKQVYKGTEREMTGRKGKKRAPNEKKKKENPFREIQAALDKVKAQIKKTIRVVKNILRRGRDGTNMVWFNGKCIKSLPVAVIRTPEELMSKYVKKNQPVVVKNFQDHFAKREHWTREALEKKFGHMPVRVSISETGRFDGPEDGSLWGLPPGEEVLVRPPGVTMRFEDFADLLELASRRNGSEAAVRESFYLEYLSLSQYLGSELLEMIPMPKLAEASGMEHFLTNFWMGKGNTTSPLHYDDYENLLCQIRGVKELTLFPPSDISYLYYTGRSKGILEYDYPGIFRRRILTNTDVNVVFGSSVYLDDPDLERHPLLEKATPYKVRLAEGDVLYLPAYWHHEVTSHPDPEENLNIAINFWFRNETGFAEEAEGLAAAAKAKAKSKREKVKEEL